MGACCNLIVNAVPISQVSVGPYRMSEFKQASYLLPWRYRAKPHISENCNMWYIQGGWWWQCQPLLTMTIIHNRTTSWQRGQCLSEIKPLTYKSLGGNKLYFTEKNFGVSMDGRLLISHKNKQNTWGNGFTSSLIHNLHICLHFINLILSFCFSILISPLLLLSTLYIHITSIEYLSVLEEDPSSFSLPEVTSFFLIKRGLFST